MSSLKKDLSFPRERIIHIHLANNSPISIIYKNQKSDIFQ
ncbi:hypothetical protein HMPREF0880_02974 [Yokenella regensburgei ATCC 43003]|nr:hypothetical protein HMPREF0880_02974 [Yokenella regensburgei ATCC 43003]